MYYLSLGAIFRMENSWLDEWIQYHFGIGIEHFYLFNDDEDTRVSDRILQPYVEQGLVENIHVSDMFTLIRREAEWRQRDAYRVMVKNAVGKTHWLAVIDLDEFLLPHSFDDLREFLEEYEEYGGLAVNWQIFGTGGHVRRPPTQINHLFHRAETHWSRNRFVKSMIQPDRTAWEQENNVHTFPMRDGKIVNENHEQVNGMTHDISVKKIQVNHYVLRSWQDFWEVKSARQRFNCCGGFEEGYFHNHDRNEVYDDDISKRFGHILR